MIANRQRNISRLRAQEDVWELTDFIINKKYIMEHLLWQITGSILFSFLGLAVLLVAYYIVEKLTPENTWKEIVENKNVALAIVFGAFIIGIAIIISGAIHG